MAHARINEMSTSRFFTADSIGTQNTIDSESNGLQEVVQYTRYNGCMCEDLGNNSADLCYDSTEIPEVVHVDQRSEIRFMLTDAYSEHGSMNLITSKAGHFIEVIEHNSRYPSMMKLKHNDKLLGINYQPVERYEHSIVIQMLKYMFHSASMESILLVVERQEPNENAKILEINVQVKVITRGYPEVNITAEISYPTNIELPIKCVTIKKRFECRIQSDQETNCYIISENGELCMRPLIRGDEKNVIFTCFQHHGLCMNNGNMPCPVFVGVFQCHDNRKYIMACNKSHLSLVDGTNHETLVDSMRRITIADPRFFVVAKTASGDSYFESLLYKGSYWTVEGNRLKLAERSEIEILMRGDSQFHFIPN